VDKIFSLCANNEFILIILKVKKCISISTTTLRPDALPATEKLPRTCQLFTLKNFKLKILSWHFYHITKTPTS
jgi:hypothetical protein